MWAVVALGSNVGDRQGHLNAGAVALCNMGALEVEKGSGGVRETTGGPRPLDLDLLFYGDRIVLKAGLTVPHPRWKTRAFVCLPLLEALPTLVDPEGGLTGAEWHRVRESDGTHCERYAADWA